MDKSDRQIIVPEDFHEKRAQGQAAFQNRMICNKQPEKIEILPLEIKVFIDENAGSKKGPLSMAKVILVERVIATGNVYRRILLNLPLDVALRIIGWPLEVQKSLFCWKKERLCYGLKLGVNAISELTALSKLTPAEVAKEIEKKDKKTASKVEV